MSIISSTTTALLKDPMVELRICIKAELAAMKTLIDNSGMNDALTKKISDWRNRFSIAFQNTSNIENVLKSYVTQLQLLLTDPLYGTPLDKESILGSDGFTYGGQPLQLHLSSISEPHCYRSPLNPEGTTSFTTTAHKVARYMVEWVQEKKRADDPDLIDMHKAQHLLDQHTKKSSSQLKPLPTEESEKKRIAQQEIKSLLEIYEEPTDTELFDQFEALLSKDLINQFKPLHDASEAAHKEIDRQLLQLKSDQELQFKSIKAAQTELKIRITTEAKKINTLRNELEQLEKQQKNREHELTHLKLAVEEIQYEKHESLLKTLGKVALIVGGAALAAWSLSVIFASSGIAVSSEPIASATGIKVAVAIRF